MELQDRANAISMLCINDDVDAPAYPSSKQECFGSMQAQKNIGLCISDLLLLRY